MAANKELAQTHLANINNELLELVRVMPGITCELVVEELKRIKDSVSTLFEEADNHGK